MTDTTRQAASHAESPGRSAAGEIEIQAPPERVWRALTEAAELERWFPLDASVEPGAGGRIRMGWKNEFTAESGILVWDPPRHLRTSWAWGGAVTDYLLEARGGGTLLRVVTSGFPPDAAWDDWVEGTVRGWAFELRSLRHYLERHDGEDRGVVYLRRRVRLPAEEAWARLAGPGGLDPRWLGGRRFDEHPPVQVAAVLDDPADSVARISIEPTHAEPGARDVTLWLSAWGAAREGLPEVERAWRRELERLYPEGENR